MAPFITTMSWIEKATHNLVRLSEASSLIAAMAEWHMTNGYEDLEEPIGTCDLCDHLDIRHKFEIANQHTHESLWVGSKCIDKFVPLYEHGIEIKDPIAKKQALSKITTNLIDNARRERAKAFLERLSEIQPEFADEKWMNDWKKGYSIRQLKWIAVIAKKMGIKFDSGDFRINTRRGAVLDQVETLELWQYEQLRSAFTPARRREFDETFGLVKRRPNSR